MVVLALWVVTLVVDEMYDNWGYTQLYSYCASMDVTVGYLPDAAVKISLIKEHIQNVVQSLLGSTSIYSKDDKSEGSETTDNER